MYIRFGAIFLRLLIFFYHKNCFEINTFFFFLSIELVTYKLYDRAL